MIKYLKQLCIIALFSFLGALLNAIIPFPIPAAVYGLVLLFLAFQIGIVKPDDIRETSDFLIFLLPLMFVAPLVGIVKNISLVADNLVAIVVIIIVCTAITYGIAGVVTQLIINRKKRQENE